VQAWSAGIDSAVIALSGGVVSQPELTRRRGHRAKPVRMGRRVLDGEETGNDGAPVSR
jgi:hypothetical protein